MSIGFPITALHFDIQMTMRTTNDNDNDVDDDDDANANDKNRQVSVICLHTQCGTHS